MITRTSKIDYVAFINASSNGEFEAVNKLSIGLKQDWNEFMNGLYLQYEELWKVAAIRKDGNKVNVIYIVDRHHQRSVIVADHSRNFKGI